MVFVNDKKFACESCIKGHRSSNCQHTERPLFEIKKKGRPVSQCERCRELRKTKRMHSKCTCSSMLSITEAGPSSQTATAMVGAEEGAAPKPLARARRFKPIAPALPNGIKDILPPTAVPTGSASLNLCRCGGRDAAVCTCGHERARPASLAGSGGLAALAQAAAFCCSNDMTSTIVLPQAPLMVAAALEQSSTVALQEDSSRKHPRGCCSSQPSSRPPSPKPKRSKRASHAHAHDTPSTSESVTLPPLFNRSLPWQDSHNSVSAAPPAFPPIPSFSAVTSYEAPECCCGTDCACPGCLKHRGAAHASQDFEDCAEGSCGICVDHEGGAALPESAFAASHGGFASTSSVGGGFAPSFPPFSLSSSRPQTEAHPAPAQKSPIGPAASGSTSFIDAFFARAAALPPPPPPTRRPGTLDPTDVRVYPRELFARGKEAEERKAAFGLVAVPKLECHCPGGCGCPEGRCACGESCTGCGEGAEAEAETDVVQERERIEAVAVAAGGCCC